ncbi:hypothetical protein L228DRAFT_85995 [Xylona heveae TC161]|uniref:N-acetyltransferase domain-containing protein n=1 Tax=Xylona heveae (strain CBS 132557 / TC161) TaxID=1328760 RepID=A0A165HVD8_XYLHT|nr:hypothetical protein L228DRAFT_85995 [Xylona heveae TC161]KZF23974.1 hypothetical protein L228DRAFT_85995 [Xylona heveae TC161]
MSTQFISMLTPPGSVLNAYDPEILPADQPDTIPDTFKEAMEVRHEVFVKEQNVPAENEVDVDDPRSFHWVVYASVANTGEGGSAANDYRRPRNAAGNVGTPVGTVRLVPPPHPPHPQPLSHHKIDNAEGLAPVEGQEAHEKSSTKFHDGKEPYVKLGRLATLAPYRGLGLGRLLVNAALEWAKGHPQEIVPPLSPMAREALKVEGGEPAEDTWRGLVLVHAQESVQHMWEKLGFERDESMGTWDEEGIIHVGMWKRLDVPETV